MSVKNAWRRLARRCVGGTASAACSLLLTGLATSALAAPGPQRPEVSSSAIDAQLFYQLLIGELELRGGEAGTAYEVILDAARRTRNEQLFRRAVEIALQGRAGDQALAATRAWRSATPQSLEAMRMELQILTALNRVTDAAEPLAALLAATPEAERASLVAGVPTFLQRAGDRQQAAQLIEKLLTPYTAKEATRVQARVAIGRGWLAAGESGRALTLAKQAHDDDANASGPALLGLELMASQPEAESLVLATLSRPGSEPALRLAYVRALAGAQRYTDAISQLQTVTRQQPEVAAPWLTLGALYIETRQPAEGEAALKRYIELTQAQGKTATPEAAETTAGDDDAEDAAATPSQGLSQAWLLMSQAAEQRKDYAAAAAWLDKVDDPRRAIEVQTRRAALLARQGKVAEARALLHQTPEGNPGDSRAKLVAEAEVLRGVKQWAAAYEVLGEAVARFPTDTDLLYEQAMMAEKLARFDDMERQLRKVIEFKPDHAHAHNALGYSLADRGVRLPEARQLVQRALTLMPGDPFISDSLGWVEFRSGNSAEAMRLLRQAYAVRPDTEIGVHLGEVLWVAGQKDEARRIWRESRGRDATNEVLLETLARLKVDL